MVFHELFLLRVAIGFNVETVQYKNLKMQVWDLGGQTSIRPYWRCALFSLLLNSEIIIIK